MAAGVAMVDGLDVSDRLTNEEMMLPLTQHGLSANYDSAAALTKQHIAQDRPPESANSASPLRAGLIPHRSCDDTSVVSGRGSLGSSIQAGSSPSRFRRRSATSPGP